MKKWLMALLCVLLVVMQCSGAMAGLSLPADLTEIQAEAFEGDRSIGGVVELPSGVKRIGSEAFKDTSVYAMWLPSGIESIGSNVLQNTGAVYAVVPSERVSLGDGALSGVGCILTSYGSNVAAWAAANGVECYDFYQYNWHDGFCYAYSFETMEAKLLFARSNGKSGSVTIPAYMDNFLVTEIGPYAFARLNGVTEINLPATAMNGVADGIDWPNAPVNFYQVGSDVEVPENATELPMAESFKVMNVGDAYYPWIEALPEGEPFWTWTSTNDQVVTVDQDGRVEAVGLGSAAVMAVLDYGENGVYFAKCDFDVRVPMVEITIMEDVISIPVGRYESALYNFVCDGLAENVVITTSCDDASIVELDGSAGFTGIAPGRATVTYTATLGDASDSDTVIVDVYDPALKLDHSNLYAYVGREYQLTLLTEVPETANVTWRSDSDEIATIDENGLVRIHNIGETRLHCTVEYENGTAVTADCVLQAREFYLEWEWIDTQYMMAGESRRLAPVLMGSLWQEENDALQTRMISSDESILSYEGSTATAHRAGTVRVTAHAETIGHVSETTFLVVISDETINMVPMDRPDATMNPGDEIEMWPSVDLPGDCEHFWTWTSSNEAVASYMDGRVVAGELGEATLEVTVKCGENGEYGVFRAQAQVRVTEPRVTINMHNSEWHVPVGRLVNLEYDYEIDGLEENLQVFFESADPEIVNPDNQIAESVGTTTVTYVLDLHGVQARGDVLVHVYEPNFALNISNLFTFTGFEEQLSVVSELPEDARVEWQSTDENIFTIDNNGLLTAHNPGRAYAVCWVSYSDGTVLSSDCMVEVCEWLLTWNINNDFANPQFMLVGETDRHANPGVWCMVSPQHSLDQLHVTITSSDDSIVSVNESRKMTAHREGTATIYCHAEYYGRTADYEYTVIVEAPYVHVGIHNGYEEMQVGDDNRQVNVWEDTNGPITRRVYTSSDERVVKVGTNGVMTAMGPGEATVTYTIYSGNYSASAQMTVVVHGYEATLSPAEVTLKKGESTMFTYQVDAGDATEDHHEFRSSNEQVAIVNYEGLVTAVGAGSATITFDARYHGQRVLTTATVHVVDDDAKITLNEQSITLGFNEKFQLIPTFSGEATDITWSVSNRDAIRVDENGLVTLHNFWSENMAVYVYCTATVDGVTETASCMVRCDMDRFIALCRSLNMNVGDQTGLWHEVHLAEDQPFTMEFLVEDESIVSVKFNSAALDCQVTALAEGSTTITLNVYAADGSLIGTRECEVYVGAEKPRFTDAEIAGEYFRIGTEGNNNSESWVNVYFTPDELTDMYGFYLESSDSSIVRVDDGQLLRGVNPGKATITLHVDEHPELTKTATVYVSNITYNADRELMEGYRAEMAQGETITLSVNGIPEDFPKYDINWGFDGNMVSEISRTDTSITLRARSTGETWVGVNVDTYCNNGENWDFCLNITGDEQPGWLNWRTANLVIGDEIDVWPEFDHESVTDWRTTNDAVATVENGHVKAVGNGVCEIEAECRMRDGSTKVVVMDVTVSDREWTLVHIYNIPSAMVKGYTYNINPHILHTGVNAPPYTLEISNPELGYFDEQSRFHAEQVGTAILTVTVSEGGRSESLSKQITITEPDVRMENDYYSLRPNRSIQLNLVPRAGKEIASATWRSNNTNLVQVDGNGIVTAMANSNGRAMIVASVTFTDGTTANANCFIDLIPDWEVYLHAWRDQEGDEWSVGDTREFWVNCDTNATPEEITFTWWANDAEAMSIQPVVDDNGTVYNHHVRVEGLRETETRLNCRIEVIGQDGVIHTWEESFWTNIRQPYFNLNPDPTEYTLHVGEWQYVNWNCDWNWVDVAGWTTVSSDESVATFTRNDVYAVGNGNATITRTYYSSTGEEVGSASVHVTVLGPDVSVTPAEATINVGESLALTKVVDLHGLEDHGSNWWSEDNGIASVTPNGTVYGVNPGTVRIWYEQHTNDGSAMASCLVTVTGEASVRLNETNLTLWGGSHYQLEMTTNLGAPDHVNWWSTHGNIEVDNTGYVTAHVDEIVDCIGSIYCEVTYGEDTYRASCQVKVPKRSFGIENWGFGNGHWLQIGALNEVHQRNEGIWNATSQELTVEFWSDDPSVVEIVESGSSYCQIRSVNWGETFVHMRLSAPSGENYTWDLFVRVGENPALTLLRPWHDLYVVQAGDGGWLHVEAQPNYTGCELRYTSRDENVVTMNHDGWINGHNPGRTTVDVEVVGYPEFNFSVEVLVLDELRVVAANGQNSFKPGDKVQLMLENATWTENDGCSIEWSQGHGGISLDQNGVLTIGERGREWLDLWVYVRFPNGYDRAWQFNYEVLGDQPYMLLTIGDNQDHLRAGVGMEVGLDIRSNCWDQLARTAAISDNVNVVTLVEYDEVNRGIKCVGVGEATITYTMTLNDGTVLVDTLPVSVGEIQPPSVVCLPQSYVIRVGERANLHNDWSNEHFNIWPNVYFTSSNEDILTIVNPMDGNPFYMMGVAPGSAEVTVHASYAEMTAEHTVTITVIE